LYPTGKTADFVRLHQTAGDPAKRDSILRGSARVAASKVTMCSENPGTPGGEMLVCVTIAVNVCEFATGAEPIIGKTDTELLLPSLEAMQMSVGELW
jgi:hypothetical protein